MKLVARTAWKYNDVIGKKRQNNKNHKKMLNPLECIHCKMRFSRFSPLLFRRNTTMCTLSK